MIALDISTYAFPRTYWMSKALDAVRFSLCLRPMYLFG